jgi:hypothetical protein
MVSLSAIDVEDQSTGSVQQHLTMTGGKKIVVKRCKEV